MLGKIKIFLPNTSWFFFSFHNDDFLRRRFVDIDHGDLLNDPFGRKKGNLRLLDRQTNVKAGIIQRFEKYTKNPKLLNKTLTNYILIYICISIF